MKSHCFSFVCDDLYCGVVLFLIFYFFYFTSSVSGTYRKTRIIRDTVEIYFTLGSKRWKDRLFSNAPTSTVKEELLH